MKIIVIQSRTPYYAAVLLQTVTMSKENPIMGRSPPRNMLLGRRRATRRPHNRVQCKGEVVFKRLRILGWKLQEVGLHF